MTKMTKQMKKMIISLFNCGTLTVKTANYFYEQQGYAVVFKNGKVIDLVKEWLNETENKPH